MDENIVIDLDKTRAAISAAKADKEFEKIEERVLRLPQYKGRVPSKNFLRKFDRIGKGEVYWIENEHSLFIVAEITKKGISLRPLDLNASISTGLTIYEMNQIMTSKEPLFDWEDKEVAKKKEEELSIFFYETAATYYLMYSRDLHYFTFFKNRNPLSINSEILPLIKECLGSWDIISIDADLGDEPLIEIWVREKDGKEKSDSHMFYLFPYDYGIIEFGEL